MLRLLVWSFTARPLSLSLGCSRAFGSGRVLGEVYLLERHVSTIALCRLLPRVVPRLVKVASKTSVENIRECKEFTFPSIFNMSDLSDSENEALSRSIDITGSSSLVSSTSSSSTRATAPRDRTPDHLSGLSDVPSQSDPVMPISRGQEGAARLEEILQVGSGTRLDRWFIEDLHWVAKEQPAPVVDLTADAGEVPERAASQTSTSGREDSQGSESSAPSGEPIQARQRPTGRAMRINDQRVYRRADQEMVGLAGDRPVYSVDNFTSAVTLRYLAALREKFLIPNDVDLVVPGRNDLPSRLPPGHITLSAKYFRAGLRLPFHPYLSPLVLGVILLPRLQGNVHYWVPGLRQAVQAPVVLYEWLMAARAPHIREHSAPGAVRSRAEPTGTAVPIKLSRTQLVRLFFDIWPDRRPTEDFPTRGGHHPVPGGLGSADRGRGCGSGDPGTLSRSESPDRRSFHFLLVFFRSA
ncbi:hypothetical protein TIFTF001_014168 [Ficus carica]|uniref:Uncharacterized protein n=1 Tax=Ficus carica TaxID=3494 RepID=A0AA88A291_FICCA|nr:hypothetical protein TIFTF001_014168 [Ficus carica]